MIGFCLATEYRQYKRVSDWRSEQGNSGETLVTCFHPEDAGETILNSQDKQLLRKQSFESFSNCKFLRLVNLGIVDVEIDVFSTMHNLKYLTIGNDDIVIRPGMFDGLNLKILSLYNLSINVLPEKIFDGLDRLMELLLHQNPLNGINSESFYGLSRVHRVRLDYSNVIVTPGLFKHMPGLSILDISGTPFEFNPNMWSNVALESLRLDNFGLSDLNVDIWTGLEGTLRRLYLNFNHFQSIRAHSFQYLTKLQYLQLNECGIQHINAQAFEGLTAIIKISLDGNDIINIDINMFGSTPLDNQVELDFGCSSSPCIQDLCWLEKRMSETHLERCGRQCNNYDRSVEQYLKDEC